MLVWQTTAPDTTRFSLQTVVWKGGWGVGTPSQLLGKVVANFRGQASASQCPGAGKHNWGTPLSQEILVCLTCHSKISHSCLFGLRSDDWRPCHLMHILVILIKELIMFPHSFIFPFYLYINTGLFLKCSFWKCKAMLARMKSDILSNYTQMFTALIIVYRQFDINRAQ